MKPFVLTSLDTGNIGILARHSDRNTTVHPYYGSAAFDIPSCQGLLLVVGSGA